MISATASDWDRNNAKGLQPNVARKINRGISMAVASNTERIAGRVVTTKNETLSGDIDIDHVQDGKSIHTEEALPGPAFLVTHMLQLPPVMPYKGQRGSLQGLNWNHHQAPPNSCEDAPGSCIIR